MRAGDVIKFHDFTLRPVYAKHTPDSVGVILECAGVKVYITGDTAPCDELFAQKAENVDVLLTCINGIYNNLNPKEAAALSAGIGAKLTIPMHFGVVPANTVRPEFFLREMAAVERDVIVLVPEEHYLLGKDGSRVCAELLTL